MAHSVWYAFVPVLRIIISHEGDESSGGATAAASALRNPSACSTRRLCLADME
ncbi:hypothetical protein E2562_027871, partial [Oryza meyeriana var. granulata]